MDMAKDSAEGSKPCQLQAASKISALVASRRSVRLSRIELPNMISRLLLLLGHSVRALEANQRTRDRCPRRISPR